MMKRICAVLLGVCILLSGFALADEKPGKEFFQTGKKALALLAADDVDGVLEKLDFQFDEGSGLSEEGFRHFVSDSFTLLSSDALQQEVAACWYDGRIWRLGIPLVEPVTDDVEVLVFTSHDLVSFCGYEASTWKMMNDAVAQSAQAFWNVEYDPGTPVLLVDH